MSLSKLHCPFEGNPIIKRRELTIELLTFVVYEAHSVGFHCDEYARKLLRGQDVFFVRRPKSLLDFGESLRTNKGHASEVDTQNTVSPEADVVLMVTRGHGSKQTILCLRLPSHLARVGEDAIGLNRKLRPTRVSGSIHDLENGNKRAVAEEVDEFHCCSSMDDFSAAVKR